jgi:hypothetical protein
MLFDITDESDFKMTNRTAIILAIVIIAILFFPIAIAISGGIFGLVFGVLGGLIGGTIGLIGAVIGGIFSIIGAVLSFLFSWPFNTCTFFDNDLFLITALIIVAVLASRKRNVERRHRSTR